MGAANGGDAFVVIDKSIVSWCVCVCVCVCVCCLIRSIAAAGARESDESGEPLVRETAKAVRYRWGSASEEGSAQVREVA